MRQVDDFVAAFAATLGLVSVLVVNATGLQPEARLEDVPWDEHLAQLELFVKSPVLLGRAVVDGMRARGSGRDRSYPRVGAQLAPFGITVKTVAPGFVPIAHAASFFASEGPGVRDGPASRR